MNWIPVSISPELFATAIVSGIALLVVAVPFWRELRIALRARASTRVLACDELQRSLEGAVRAREPMALVLLRVLDQSLRENEAGHHPTEFLRDASKQHVMNEYETRWSQPLSMYANLLPPIGFIGTTLGLMILFASMHLSDQTLEVGALGLALTSTIFALMGFATLEGLKIALYGRLLQTIEYALGVPLASEVRQGSGVVEAAAPAG